VYREIKILELPDTGKCPLCDIAAFEEHDLRLGASMTICRSCGKLRYADHGRSLSIWLRQEVGKDRYKISHQVRSISESAFGKRDNSLFPIYSMDDFRQMLDRPDPPVQEKLHILLRHLGNVSEFPGHLAGIDSRNDYTIIGAKNYGEFLFYMDTLNQQGFLSLQEYTQLDTWQDPDFRLLAKGWTELERIAQLSANSSNAFIAMWFDSSRLQFEQAINAAVTSAGYTPIRIDRVEHLNRIDDEIIARIRQSKFLIADFTGQRNGVYFEAGFMLGLGRPVIWICEKGELSKVHFDTRQYNTIDYSDAIELEKRLLFRIEANLGKGPNSQPNQPQYGS
jgi:nucleoside 2-deoxyribosyltransferase